MHCIALQCFALHCIALRVLHVFVCMQDKTKQLQTQNETKQNKTPHTVVLLGYYITVIPLLLAYGNDYSSTLGSGCGSLSTWW
jgi:hypothetical protein